MAVQRFPVAFTGVNRAMIVLGLAPRNSFIEITDGLVIAKMGWAFRATIPLGSIGNPAPDHRRVLGWGAHGWRGRWLVNGSSHGIVSLQIEPATRARILTVIPVALRELRISVEHPDDLIAALADREVLGHRP